jgi:hypothetical protein
MANTIQFRRELCPASASIGFESQIDVYLRDESRSASSELRLAKITTANVALVDGLLVADFHLNDDVFGQPEEIVLDSMITVGRPDAAPGETAALQLHGMVLTRRWP